MGRAPENLDASVFESLWPLSSVTIGDVLPSYESRVVGVIDSDQGRYVYKLTPWREGVGHAELDQSAEIFDFLESKAFTQAPKLVHTRAGGRMADVGTSSLLVLEHIAGSTPSESPDNYRKLGELVGRVSGFSDYDNNCPITFHGIHRALRGTPAERLTDRSREEFLGLIDRLPVPESLPESLVHTELRLGNSIERSDGSLVAIDWDEAGMGPRLYDPASSLISVFVSEELEFDDVGAAAFYEGYRGAGVSTADERTAFFDAAVLIASRYISWGDAEARWRRIQWALDHKEELLTVAFG